MKVRRDQKAVHANAGFEVLEIEPKVFGIKSYCEDQIIYAVTNISSAETTVSLTGAGTSDRMTDLISGKRIDPNSFALRSYQYAWLTIDDS